MKSIFNSIIENIGKSHQTVSFRKDKSIFWRIIRVVAFIHQHYIGQSKQSEWSLRINNGCITLQNKNKKHKVITIFCDIDNKLAVKENFNIDKNPIVVGIELIEELPFTRETLRNELEKMYSNYYRDPRVGHSKYYLLPQTNHFYDILFLPLGQCEDVNRRLIDQYSILIQNEENTSKELDLPIINDIGYGKI